MAQFDTTATCQAWAHISRILPNTPQRQTVGTTPVILLGNTGFLERGILSFKMPEKPTGAVRIEDVRVVLTVKSAISGTPSTLTWNLWQVQQQWKDVSASAGTASWNYYQTPGLAWTTTGGDLSALMGSIDINSGSYGASFSGSISPMPNWGERFSILISTAASSALGYRTFATYLTNGTTSWMPHLAITATDDPPASITDLSVSPDLS